MRYQASSCPGPWKDVGQLRAQLARPTARGGRQGPDDTPRNHCPASPAPTSAPGWIGDVPLTSPARGITKRSWFSPLRTPAPSPCSTGSEDDSTSGSPSPRSCWQLRSRGQSREGAAGRAPAGDPGTWRLGNLRATPPRRASGLPPAPRFAAPRRLLPSGSQASLRLLVLPR